jgi:hypothetical protein
MELLIASAMMLLLLASCVTALRSAMQYYRRVSEQTEMENSLLIAIGAMTRDVAETAPEALAWQDVAPEGPSLTFPVPRDNQGNLLIDHSAGSRLLFGSMVSYRVEGSEKKLVRYQDPLADQIGVPPHPLSLTPPYDSTFYASTGRQPKVLAIGAVELTLTAIDVTDGGGTVTSVTTDFPKADIFRVQLKLERQESRRYAVSMVSDLVPKN